MDGLYVLSDGLRDVASGITLSNAEISAVLKELDTQISELQDAWDSDARRRFSSQYAELGRVFRELQVVIESYARHLRLVADSFDASESRLESTAGQF